MVLFLIKYESYISMSEFLSKEGLNTLWTKTKEYADNKDSILKVEIDKKASQESVDNLKDSLSSYALSSDVDTKINEVKDDMSTYLPKVSYDTSVSIFHDYEDNLAYTKIDVGEINLLDYYSTSIGPVRSIVNIDAVSGIKMTDNHFSEKLTVSSSGIKYSKKTKNDVPNAAGSWTSLDDYATKAYVDNKVTSYQFQVVNTLPDSPDNNTIYFIVKE